MCLYLNAVSNKNSRHTWCHEVAHRCVRQLQARHMALCHTTAALYCWRRHKPFCTAYVQSNLKRDNCVKLPNDRTRCELLRYDRGSLVVWSESHRWGTLRAKITYVIWREERHWNALRRVSLVKFQFLIQFVLKWNLWTFNYICAPVTVHN